MELAVTSSKSLKINAVANGFAKVFENVVAKGVSIPDQVAPQPIGFEAGRLGALGRIQYFRENLHSHPLKNLAIVSIENFITEIGKDTYFDIACVAIDDRKYDIKAETYSQGVLVPNKFVEEAKKRTSKTYININTGYEITAGQIIEEENSFIKSDDFHVKFISTSREEILTFACQILAGEYAKLLVSKISKEPILFRTYISNVPFQGANTLANRFRIMQWNVLAHALMTENVQKSVGERITHFKRELQVYSADIICTQETDLYNYFFNTFMSELGYGSCFMEKINSPCLLFPNNYGPCGCAIFYNEKIFKLLSKHEFNLKNEFNEPSNQILLMLELKHLPSLKKIYIANTHLKAMPGFESVRLGQAKDAINQFVKLNMENVIFCGDFNCDTSEDAYIYLTSQTDFPFKSAYSVIDKEPNYTCQWSNPETCGQTVVDYIFYSCKDSTVKPIGVHKVPEKVNLLHSNFQPSDHWSLIADFTI